MREHADALGAIMLAQELAGRPLVLLAEDVVVEVLEELELDRFAEPFGGLIPSTTTRRVPRIKCW